MTLEEIASDYMGVKVSKVWEGYDGYTYLFEDGTQAWANADGLIMHAYKMGLHKAIDDRPSECPCGDHD